MRYKAGTIHRAGEGKLGVLLTNLGTPQAPTAKALRVYLAEFLSDPRVVEIPKLLWLCILHGIILRVRPKKSAKAYETVWTERGSPLKFHTDDQAKALSAKLNQDLGSPVLVDYAMRYGEPSITAALQRMAEAHCDRLLILPLYPQYASATTGSTFDAVAKDYQRRRALPNLRFIANYHDYAPYIDALAESIMAHWQVNGRAEKLLLSYHGLPKYSHDKGDPYFTQCQQTSALIAQALDLKKDHYMTVFQSRFGAAEWLQPYTEQSLKALAKEGVKSVQVVCPGFPADCLETIEEIGVENRDYFLEGGGERYEYIPALNASDIHIQALSELVQQNLKGW